METGKKYVSEHCFHDVELKNTILNSVRMGVCPFTKREGHLMDIEDFIEFFIELLQLFIEKNDSSKTVIDIIQEDWDLFSDKEIGKEILIEVKNRYTLLLDCNKQADYNQDIRDVVSYRTILKEEIKYKTRYITDIKPLIDRSWDKLLGIETYLDPDLPLYRARIHASQEEACFRCEDMGVPSKDKSREGRANARGIPYLYLCDQFDTVFYEVRANYLDEVSVGTFMLKNRREPLKIADFSIAPSLFSVDVDPAYTVKLKLLTKAISTDLSKPIRRYDSELDYVPTQFICEFIRELSGVQGIRYISSLRTDEKGTNVVIFNPELMECVDVKKRTVSSVTIQSI